MNIIFLLIGVSLTVATLFLVGFIWSVKSGQYEDNYTPSVRMLFDDHAKINDEIKINGDVRVKNEEILSIDDENLRARQREG